MNDSPLGLFGKYLTLWVAISIVIGIILGNYLSIFFRINLIKFNIINCIHT